MVRAEQVVSLAPGQEEADRIAKGVDQSVDFSAQSASRAPDGLVFAVFFLAPAPC